MMAGDYRRVGRVGRVGEPCAPLAIWGQLHRQDTIARDKDNGVVVEHDREGTWAMVSGDQMAYGAMKGGAALPDDGDTGRFVV